jgi:hypothetical protein
MLMLGALGKRSRKALRVGRAREQNHLSGLARQQNYFGLGERTERERKKEELKCFDLRESEAGKRLGLGKRESKTTFWV